VGPPIIRVLIVDDQPLIRSGLAMMLDAEHDMSVVGEAGDGLSALEQAAALRPDVVLMDVLMPGMDGVEATRRLSTLETGHNLVRVLMLTTYDTDAAVLGAVRAGACGFVLKSATSEQLMDAIREVMGGGRVLAPEAAEVLMRDYRGRTDSTAPPPRPLRDLTLREREVLILVAHGLSNAEIAARLVVAEATVKTHFGRILSKVGLRDRGQAVAFAYQTGLVKAGETAP
jgi:DNA-binding NarL/FixJ family response regulator